MTDTVYAHQIRYVALRETQHEADAKRAARHLLRAMEHEANGKMAWAEGSYRKAHRNLSRILSRFITDAVTETIAARIAKDMEDMILNGDKHETL